MTVSIESPMPLLMILETVYVILSGPRETARSGSGRVAASVWVSAQGRTRVTARIASPTRIETPRANVCVTNSGQVRTVVCTRGRATLSAMVALVQQTANASTVYRTQGSILLGFVYAISSGMAKTARTLAAHVTQNVNQSATDRRRGIVLSA